jgi:hypothetical protein
VISDTVMSTSLDKITDLDKAGRRRFVVTLEVHLMLASLIVYAPLIACPLVMGAMMGIPALIIRAKRRNTDVTRNEPPEGAGPGSASDVASGASEDSAVSRFRHDAAPQPSALAGSVANKP